MAVRRICKSLNDHRGTGGQTRLAELLGVHPTLIRKKLAGTVPISKKDELAIRQVVG
jgi:DNA-binding transcriptional regulator YdaS (Cro superfamily)